MKHEVAKHQCWFDYNLRADETCSPYQAVMKILAKKARIKPTVHNFGDKEKWWGAKGGLDIWKYLPEGLEGELRKARF
eukprot:g10062.t1